MPIEFTVNPFTGKLDAVQNNVAITTSALAALGTEHVAALTPTYIGALTNTQIAQLTTTQVGLLTTTQLAALTTTQVGAILTNATTTQIAGLTSTNINALVAGYAITTTQIAGLTSTHVAVLTPAVVAALTDTQIAQLTTTQIAGLSNTAVAALHTAIATNLTHDDLEPGFRESAFHSWSGSVVESISAVVTSNGSVVTLTVQADPTGDLTALFTPGPLTIDCTPALTATFTPGTDASPQMNYAYILESAPTVITVSTVGFPATGTYVPIGTYYVQSAATVATYGTLKNHAWTDHIDAVNDNGHISHINKWIRHQPATWISGCAVTPTLTTGTTPDTLTISVATGKALQLHEHTTPAFASSGGGTTNLTTFFCANHLTPNTVGKDLCSAAFLQDTAGNAVTLTNKRISFIVWAAIAQTDSDFKVFVNLPTGFYTADSAAIADDSKFTDYSIPSAYRGVGFLLAKLTYHVTNSTPGSYALTLVEQLDLRGQFPSTAAGGSAAADHENLSGLLGGSTVGHWHLTEQQVTDLGSLTTTQVASLGTTQMAFLSATAVSGITTTAVAGLTTTQMGALSTTQLAGAGLVRLMTPTQALALTVTQIAALQAGSTGDVLKATTGGGPAWGTIASGGGGDLTTTQIAGLDAAEMAFLSATAVSGLTTTALQGLTATQFASLPSTAIGGLTYTQMAALTTTAAEGLWVSLAKSPPVSTLSGAAAVANYGGYRYYKFTSSGTLTVPEIMILGGAIVTTVSVEHAGIGGGGGGGSGQGSGGGGAGGVRRETTVLTGGSYAIVIGNGGAAGVSQADGTNGSNSTFDAGGANEIVSKGGGGGSRGGPTGETDGLVGGSGGGAGGLYSASSTAGTGGAADTSPEVHGYAGGNSTTGTNYHYAGAGGGGAGGAGGNAILNTNSGNGGIGVQDLSDWATALSIANDFAGGGSGGKWQSASGSIGTAVDGGGAGSTLGGVTATAGTVNTGGGGGGGGGGDNDTLATGGAGGKGVWLLRHAI